MAADDNDGNVYGIETKLAKVDCQRWYNVTTQVQQWQTSVDVCTWTSVYSVNWHRHQGIIVHW